MTLLKGGEMYVRGMASIIKAQKGELQKVEGRAWARVFNHLIRSPIPGWRPPLLICKKDGRRNQPQLWPPFRREWPGSKMIGILVVKIYGRCFGIPGSLLWKGSTMANQHYGYVPCQRIWTYWMKKDLQGRRETDQCHQQEVIRLENRRIVAIWRSGRLCKKRRRLLVWLH